MSNSVNAAAAAAAAAAHYYENSVIENLSYQSCYCEENVYKLAERFDQHGYYGYVLFITSLSQQTPVWCQKSSNSPQSPVIWDYHVTYMLTHKPVKQHMAAASDSSTGAGCFVEPLGDSCVLVFDQDSTLSFPYPATDYCKHGVTSSKRTQIQSCGLQELSIALLLRS